MSYLVRAIFGKRALGQLTSGDYVDWAGEMLTQGHDSHSLRILAGLDAFTSTFEAEDYFLRSVRELGLTVPDRDAAVLGYACGIAQRIIDGELTGRQAVRELYKLCLATQYRRDLMVWLYLDDALDSLLAGEYPYTYKSATLENFEEIVRREAESFIAGVGG
jgi:hypothetical protein